MVSKILLGYEKALWPKKLEISQASQILTNDRQIWFFLSYLITTVQNALCFTFLIGTLCTAFDSFCEFQSEKQMASLIDINHV